MIKENKIPTTADILSPLAQVIDRMKAAMGARKQHIEANQNAIKVLQGKNRDHQAEIMEAEAFIAGCEKTFGIK